MLNDMIQVNEVSTLQWESRIGIMGSSGIGKTTLVFELLDKWLPNEYIIIDTGMEGGLTAIEGARYVSTPDWKSFVEVVNAIAIEKMMGTTNIKAVAIDTMDELQRISEEYILESYNAKNPRVKLENINAGDLGYGQGINQATTAILNEIKKLEDLGIGIIQTFHSRLKEVDHEITGETYKELTASLGQTTFNKYLTKIDLLGTIWTNLDLDTVTTKNFFGKIEKENRKVGEQRIITFRDTSSFVRSKSRFPDIAESIPLGRDEFDKAITDAIKKASKLSDAEYSKRYERQLKDLEITELDDRFKEDRRLFKMKLFTKFNKFTQRADNESLFDEVVKKFGTEYQVKTMRELYESENVGVDKVYNLLKTIVNQVGTKYDVIELIEG